MCLAIASAQLKWNLPWHPMVPASRLLSSGKATSELQFKNRQLRDSQTSVQHFWMPLQISKSVNRATCPCKWLKTWSCWYMCCNPCAGLIMTSRVRVYMRT